MLIYDDLRLTTVVPHPELPMSGNLEAILHGGGLRVPGRRGCTFRVTRLFVCFCFPGNLHLGALEVNSG